MNLRNQDPLGEVFPRWLIELAMAGYDVRRLPPKERPAVTLGLAIRRITLLRQPQDRGGSK